MEFLAIALNLLVGALIHYFIKRPLWKFILAHREEGAPPKLKLSLFTLAALLLLSAGAAALGVLIYPHFIFRDPAGRLAMLIALPLFIGWFLHGAELTVLRANKPLAHLNSSTFMAACAFLNLAVRFAVIAALGSL